MIGRVLSSEVAKNRDGDLPVRLLKVEISEPDDSQTAELMLPPGLDINPPVDSNVLIFQEGSAWKIAFASDDNVLKEVDVGEIQIYSSVEGQKVAWVRCYKNGDIEIKNSLGEILLNGTTGQASINGNFTVDV